MVFLGDAAEAFALFHRVSDAVSRTTFLVDLLLLNLVVQVGLAGEVRTVPQCDRRISECARLGFTTIVVPRSCARRTQVPEGVNVIGVDTVAQALSVIF